MRARPRARRDWRVRGRHLPHAALVPIRGEARRQPLSARSSFHWGTLAYLLSLRSGTATRARSSIWGAASLP